MGDLALQQAFFASMADPQVVRHLFEHLPEVFFFTKDRQSRLMGASSNMLERLGLKRESDIVGRVDEDFFDPQTAQIFREDDQIVFTSGKPLVNRLEMWYDEQRRPAWFLTTKMPVQGLDGSVVGLVGITRPDAGTRSSAATAEARNILAYLQKHTDRVVSTAEVAHACGLSERTLYRRVQESMGVTPYELMIRLRIQKAAEALVKTRLQVIDVALRHGFCDQSTFTQHFRRRMGMTPLQFRKQYQG